jgi:hypothetical protein
MTLQEAIDFASVHADTDEFGINVAATISMHDEANDVFVGSAFGLSDMFRRDLPLLNWGTGTIGGGTGGTTTGGGSRFRRQPTPGFSTRGLAGDVGSAAMVVVTTGSGTPPNGTGIPIDFSVRSDPGIPWLSFLGMGPSIQIEIERLSAASPGGTVTAGIKLEASQDWELLRAVGPSLQDPARKASYTVTLTTFSRPG